MLASLFFVVVERLKSLMNGEGTDPRLSLCFGTFVDFIQFDSALGAISLCFTSPEVLLMKINYMKHYISTGGSLSKKRFKSHYAGDRERDVCIVAVGLTVGSVQLPFWTSRDHLCCHLEPRVALCLEVVGINSFLPRFTAAQKLRIGAYLEMGSLADVIC